WPTNGGSSTASSIGSPVEVSYQGRYVAYSAAAAWGIGRAGGASVFHRLDVHRRSPGSLTTIAIIVALVSLTSDHAVAAPSARPGRGAQPGVEGPPAERSDLPSLERGTPVRRTIASGQDHSYAFQLDANQYLEIAAEQLGIDVLLRLYAPNGEKLVSANYANGIARTENLFMVSEVGGIHRLEVHPLEKENAGEYETMITALRPATEVDRRRYAAQRSFRSGELLRSHGKPDSLREAISSYSNALSDWRAAQDPAGEANSLNGSG